MVEAEGAKSAIQDPNPVIDGRKANVNLAYIGAKPRTTATTGRQAPLRLNRGLLRVDLLCRNHSKEDLTDLKASHQRS